MHELRRRNLERFGGDEFPVPVESAAEDLVGLDVERTELGMSGGRLPTERRILVNGTEPDTRQRFTIAHELGRWLCQSLARRTEPICCRAAGSGVDPEAKALEREANVSAAELLMPVEAIRASAEANDVASGFGVLGRSVAMAALQLRSCRRCSAAMNANHTYALHRVHAGACWAR